MKIRSCCLILSSFAAALVAFAPSAGASTAYVWVGNTVDPMADHHSWSDQRNWSPQGVPGDGDSVTIAPPTPICSAHVDAVPAVHLANFTMTQPVGSCGVSVSGPGGPITVTGSFRWDSGQLAVPLTVAVGATATVAPNPGFLKVASADIDVLGVLTLAGVTGNTALRLDNPRQLRIHPGAELRSVGTNDITFNACCVNPARVINDGTVRLSGGALRITAVRFDQRKALVAGTGASLITTKAPVTATAGAVYSGGGTWNIGLQSIASFTGTQTLTAPFRLILGGEPSAPGGRLGGAFTLAGSGRLDWLAGTVEGSMTVAHGSTVHAYGVSPGLAPRKLNGRDYTTGTGSSSTVTNHGTILVDGGAALTTADRAHLVNASDGSLRIASGTMIHSMGCCVAPDRITNTGGTVVIGASSSGTAAVLDMIAYASTGGSTTIAAGEDLQLTGGAPGTLTSTTVTGGGRLVVAAPVRVSGSVRLGTTTRLALIDRGSLDGTATLSGTGNVVWAGGALSGAVTVSTTGGVVVINTARKYVRNVSGGAVPSRVRITVPTTFRSGTSALPNLVDLGSSHLTLATTSVFGNHVQIAGGTLANTGTLTINPGAGGKVERWNGDLVNTGTVAVRSGTTAVRNTYRQTAGLTSLSAGAVMAGQISTSTVALSGGTLAGTGRITMPVRNTHGTVQPGSTAVGTLRVAGYDQTSGGRLILDVGAGTADRLTVDKTAGVAGTVVYRTPSAARPSLGRRLTVLTTGAGVTWHPHCSYTTGWGSSTAHWAASPTSRTVVAVRAKGADTHC